VGVLVMDRAGWHKSRRLAAPENITILLLPAYSPELNPVERLWAHLRSHHLSNRAYENHHYLLDAGAEARRQLTPELLRSVCACDYTTHELEKWSSITPVL
jgi:transposase